MVLFNFQRGHGQGGGPGCRPRQGPPPTRPAGRPERVLAPVRLSPGSWRVSPAVLLPLSVFLPRSYVTRNRGQIAAGTWTPPLQREDSDTLFRPAALRSDGGKLAYVYLIQFVIGVGLNQLLAFFAAVVYLMTQNPIAMGRFRSSLADSLCGSRHARVSQSGSTASRSRSATKDSPPARRLQTPEPVRGSRDRQDGHQLSMAQVVSRMRLTGGSPKAGARTIWIANSNRPTKIAEPPALGSAAMTDDEVTGPQVRPIDQQAGSGPPVLPGLFFLAGCGSLAMLVFGFILPEWSVNNRYVPNSCVVLDKRIMNNQAATGRTEYPQIKIRYAVNGRKHEVWAYESVITLRQRPAAQEIVDRFQVGAIYPCWYDPDRPEKAVLVRGYSWSGYVLLVVPIVFLSLGGTGLYGCFRKNQTKSARRKQLP